MSQISTTTSRKTTDQEKLRPSGAPPPDLAGQFDAVRRATEALCAPLQTEDLIVQSMPDASPTRWHLAHTTWFFETFVLDRVIPDYKPAHPEFRYLFNSYYNLVGAQFPRAKRGVLSRPTVREVFLYRADIDGRMRDVLAGNADLPPGVADIIEIGLHHEQQHQELILTDIKHAFFQNPLLPAYDATLAQNDDPPTRRKWIDFDEYIGDIGYGGDGFSYDNERPVHRHLVPAFALTDRLITNGEYLEFIQDGGYQKPELWLSDGWALVSKHKWMAPLYWFQRDGAWREFTLAGERDIHPGVPVCHVSYYEADAFARWAGYVLPCEEAWEVAAADVPIEGNFVEAGMLHPMADGAGDALWHRFPTDDAATDAAANVPRQMFGHVWEWTCSPYTAYPGYAPAPDALGEYNGKFMVNQMVLRGGSCATPQAHIRRTYRNFFPPESRWQFTGIRLARIAQT